VGAKRNKSYLGPRVLPFTKLRPRRILEDTSMTAVKSDSMRKKLGRIVCLLFANNGE